ncbi:glutamate transporter [Corynespora cassiicola Philippines]|uniref:Amino acid transporter n=1 Tax=Corynespora cassiicola Philippines TaxID=1448308 RepID=A0A2T2N2N6_CORCC|nr:glutamate transporter [Corynespora cassiicola Philippines]
MAEKDIKGVEPTTLPSPNFKGGEKIREGSPISDPALSPQRKTFWERVKEPGSVWQILIAAILAIGIGMAVTSTVDEVPEACVVLLQIPGDLWLRALKCVVMPMIICAMILAVQRLREMTGRAGPLAKWTIGYYIITTFIAIFQSCLLVGLVWSKLMPVVDDDMLQVTDEDDQDMIDERAKTQIHDVVLDMFQSLVPDNLVGAIADNALLSILVASVVIGYCIKPNSNSSIIRGVKEVEVIITKIITILIYLAPIGVFFLILPNLFRLDLEQVGMNLGILIGGTLTMMFIHLFIVIPIIFFSFTRQNPYTFWLKNSPAWITAWGTASSAATLPVTMRCVLARGVPKTVAKFAIPLGCLINMDGTAIYFPICVVFLAATQGIVLNGADYTVVALLSTLASIGTTPIPSSSLVLTVMIAQSINVPITGMYAVVVAIDWFLDRFRTAVNVSGDLFAAVIVTKMTGIKDGDDDNLDYEEEMRQQSVPNAVDRV